MPQILVFFFVFFNKLCALTVPLAIVLPRILIKKSLEVC